MDSTPAIPENAILLTGATGLIGRNVLANLLAAQPGRRFVVLSRRPAPERHRITHLMGDLRLPRLGLGAPAWASLERNVSGIIHSGAEIRFDLPLAAARAVNVAGTRTLLALARRAPRLQRFAHISTTYVTGRSPLPLPEGPLENRHGFFSSYQESKYEAEQAVLAEAGQLPVSIYRLSSVIGHSGTGAVEQYNHFHQLLRLAPRSLLPVLPGSADARVDFIASDWAAAAICWCYTHRFEPGAIRNFCAGPGEAMPMPEVLAMAYAQLGGGRPPELVSDAEFAKYTQARLRSGDTRIAQVLQAIEYLLPYFSLRQHFENTESLALLEAAGLAPVDSRSLFARVLRHMQPVRRAVPAPQPVG